MVKQLKSKVEQRIFSLSKQKLSQRAIARQLGISQSVVSKHLKKRPSSESPPKKGRPKILDKMDERFISRMAVTGKATTARDLVDNLEEYSNVRVSQNTILRSLKSGGVRSHFKIKKPFLNKGHRVKRRKFEKSFRDWDKYDWEYVVWSDETKINLHSNDGRDRTFRKKGEPLRDHNVSPTKKFGGGSLMVWGCMLPCGVGCLCRVDGAIDSQLYCDMLGDALIKSLRLYDLQTDEVIFQHDNAPSHSSHRTKRWLKRNEIEVIDWPSQSPDLNPIEHLWDHLKREIRKRKQCRDVDELWEVVKEVWSSIKPETCRKLVHSMPRRLNELRKAKGGFTSF
jgi:predicted transcriptional regulator/transposase